jgi:hypothetical protein
MVEICLCESMHLNCVACLVRGYHGAEVAEMAEKAGMSEMAKKAKMSEMPEMSKGMSSVSISEMELCPSRASR